MFHTWQARLDVLVLADSLLEDRMFLPGFKGCCARGDRLRAWNAHGLGALHADARHRQDI